MPLVFSAICPHPPLLIPAIGQDNLKKVRKTKKALENLEGDFYAAKPETVIVISPHGSLMSEAFTINHSPTLEGSFEDFGDLETKLKFQNDLGLAYQIKESVETKLPLILTANEKLDHGATVPLYYLANHLKEIQVIPIGYSLLERSVHFSFGRFIRKILDKTTKRVAVVASGDLSHRLTKTAPAGFSARGKEFDQKLIDFLNNKKIEEIMALDEELVTEAGECGFRSILILLGIMAELNFQTKILSYEGPFGVGYLVAKFEL